MRIEAPVPLGPQHALESFASGEPELDQWLHRFARQAQASRSARVFVAVDGSGAVVGYYALAASRLEAARAPERLLRGEPRTRPVPAVLLARLAVDRRLHGQGVGASLLMDALLRIERAAGSIGVRVVLVHAKSEAARAWYLRHGFSESPTDPFHLLLLLKDMRRLFQG